MFSVCLASPGVGTVESRRLRQMVSGEAGSEQGVVGFRTPRETCKRNQYVKRNLEGPNTFVGSLVVGHLGLW